jgi:hypothetical protein
MRAYTVCVRGRYPTSALPPSPSLSLPLPPSPILPSPPSALLLRRRAASASAWTLEKNKIGSRCRLEKREKNSVFNPQDPQDPQAPRAPRALQASRAKPREEEGFFGLVTHPSSIPLLGGLTPKFLSLSLHSLQGLLMLMAY